MNSKKIYALLGLGFLLLSLAYVFIYSGYYQKEKERILKENNALSVRVVIDYGNGTVDVKDKDLSNQNRVQPYTAFDVLNEAFKVDAAKQDWGTAVKCINNVCEDESKGFYWFFWHNDDFSSVSVDKYYLQDKDVIKMKYLDSRQVGM